jgi:hypothetical protein
MSVGLLLILLGALVAIFVHWGLGIALIIVGAVLLVLPHVRT